MPHSDPQSAAVYSAIAGEIRAIGQLVEQIADALVGCEELARDHIGQFQNFDLAIQCAHENAALLDRLANGEDTEEAIGSVRLTAMQNRLRAVLAPAA